MKCEVRPLPKSTVVDTKVMTGYPSRLPEGCRPSSPRRFQTHSLRSSFSCLLGVSIREQGPPVNKGLPLNVVGLTAHNRLGVMITAGVASTGRAVFAG